MKKLITAMLFVFSLVSIANANNYQINEERLNLITSAKGMEEAIGDICGVSPSIILSNGHVNRTYSAKSYFINLYKFVSYYKEKSKTDEKAKKLYLKIKLFISRPSMDTLSRYFDSYNKTLEKKAEEEGIDKNDLLKLQSRLNNGWKISKMIMNAEYSSFSGDQQQFMTTLSRLVMDYVCKPNTSKNIYYGDRSPVYNKFILSIISSDYITARKLVESVDYSWALYDMED